MQKENIDKNQVLGTLSDNYTLGLLAVKMSFNARDHTNIFEPVLNF